MELYKYINKSIILTCNNGQIFKGEADWYSPAQDNDDSQATLCVGDYEFKESEIKSIEIIN